MTRRTRAAVAAVLSAGCLVGGSVGASPAAADNIAGYSCGLSAWNQYNPKQYVIANCHYYAVYRKILKSNYTYGSCRYIPARGYVYGESAYAIIDYAVC